MQRQSLLDPLTYALAGVIGIALIVFARWAARRRGTRWESLAFRMGDVLVTEVFGAFLIGVSLGGLIAQELDDGGATGGPQGGAPVGPARRIGPVGRLGPLDPSRLPFMLGIVGAGIAILIRVDLRDLLLGGSSPGSTASSYIGAEARVIAPIRSGEFGEIALRDGLGNVMTVAATADTDIATGTIVRVIGSQGIRLVVAPITSREAESASAKQPPPSPSRS